jgi:hypothetical protein
MHHDPQAATSGIELTPSGEAYALAHLRPAGCPPGIDPLTWRQALENRVEQHLSLVTTLLALLDGMDTDPDLEPIEDDEPSIGGHAPWGREVDLELDNADTEPSLGWTDMEGRYGRGLTFDPDREVDDADDEPNLGAPEPGFAPPLYGMWRGQLPYLPAVPLDGQGAWARGRGDDDEQVNEDGGDIQDEPHDPEPDFEPDLGWSIPGADTSQGIGYTAAGYGNGESDGLENGEHDDGQYDCALISPEGGGSGPL